jgi:hypothetical protein
VTDRDLRYSDPDAETITDLADDAPTPDSASRFLLDLFDRSGGRLRLREAVERFAEEYGGRFLDGVPGNWRVAREVFDRFARLAPDVFWDAADRCWRWRYGWDRD